MPSVLVVSDRASSRRAKRPRKDWQVVVVEVGVAHKALEVKTVDPRGIAVEERGGGTAADRVAATPCCHFAPTGALDVICTATSSETFPKPERNLMYSHARKCLIVAAALSGAACGSAQSVAVVPWMCEMKSSA